MTRTILLPLALLVACTSLSTGKPSGNGGTGGGSNDTSSPTDTDGDGISDADEATAGTDPALADTDGDGLSDGEELDLGTDPLEVDTDNDGYTDYDEVQTGHDPTDKHDKIYTGGWPYNPDKDSMENPGWNGTATEGEMMPHFTSYDQYGDEFDIYDYANQGKPVIIDVSAGWCYYCQEMAKLLAGQPSYLDAYDSDPGLGRIKELVDSGDILWIEVLDQTDAGAQVDQDFLEAWDNAFPNDKIAVVADERQKFLDWLPIAGYPSIFAVNSSMIVKSWDPDNYVAPLSWAVAHAGAGE